MKKIRYACVVLAFILLSFAACLYSAEDSEGKAYDSPALKGNINIYLQRRDIGEEKAAGIFETRYPDITVNVTYTEDIEEYSKKLSTGIMAGEGPDVILFKPYVLRSVYKMAKTGVFEDLEPMIEKDKSFSMEDYNEKVMECGVIDGKRFILPLDFVVNSFLTIDEIMKENNIEIDLDNWNWDQFASIVSNLPSEDNMENKKYFSDCTKSFNEFLLESGLKYIDYDRKETYFDTPEFKALLGSYRDICRQMTAPDKVREAYGFSSGEMMKDSVLLSTSNHKIIYPYVLWKMQSEVYNSVKGNTRLYPYPTYNGKGGYIAIPYSMAAVNAGSGNKQASYEFIKTMLSKEVQIQEQAGFGAPVNIRALEELIEMLSGEEGIHEQLGFVPLTGHLSWDIKYITSNIGKCEIYDNSVANFIDRAADGYIQDKCSLEQAIRYMESDVRLFLNE